MMKDVEHFGYDYYILVDIRSVIGFIESKYNELKGLDLSRDKVGKLSKELINNDKYTEML